MANIILGLDLRVCAVKVVELRYGKEGPKITNWGMTEVPYELVDKHPEKEIAQAEALQKILTENKIHTKEAVLVVGGGDVLVKDYSMPIRSKGEAKEAIRWKVKDEIGYPIEDAVFDFVTLGPSSVEGETLFIASAAHKDTIARGIEVAKEAGLKIVGVVPVPVAMETIFSHEIAPDSIISMIYMGKRTTNICFFKEGYLQFNREVPIGGEDITQAMTSVLVSDAGKLELSYEQAEKLKRQYGIISEGEPPKDVEIPLSQLSAVMRPALERIEDEVLRTIEYYRGQIGDVPIQKVLITGGSARTPHLPEFLSKGVGIDFELADPLKHVESNSVKNKEALLMTAPQLSCAMGAALTAFLKKPAVNLLPEEIKAKWKALVKRHFNFRELSVAYLLMLALIYAFVMWQVFMTTNRIAQIDQRMKVLKPKVARLEEIERAVREEEGRKGIFKSIELGRIQIPVVMEDISLNVPSSIILDKIDVVEAAREVRISGTVFSRGGSGENILSKFIHDLSQSEGFQKVELVQAVKNESYRYEAFNFEIIGIVKKRGK